MPDSSTKSKPAKLPFYKHKTGRWAKKAKGKIHYFGYIEEDPQGVAALKLWNDQKDALLAGLTPRPKLDGLTLRELLDRYVVSKRELLDSGEIGPRYFAEVHATCKRIGDSMGLNRLVVDLGPDDFKKLRKALASVWGPVRLANEVQRVRSVFKWGTESMLIKHNISFGPDFKPPSKKVKRLARAKRTAESGKRMFDAADLRTIIGAAPQPLKAMILLGVNCGFGPGDVANLPIQAVDLKGSWVDFPRPKTGIERRIPLWPETVAAIKEARIERPRHKSPDDAGILFITKYGQRWTRTDIAETNSGNLTLTNNSPVTAEMSKLLKNLGLKRKGVSFYALRHTFRTIGDAARDQVAVNAIMGHVDDSVAAEYREAIDDERLLAVTEHVRKWLFG